MIATLKDSARRSLTAARYYREGKFVPGLTYDTGGDKRFQNAMYEACLRNARSSIKLVVHLHA